MTTIPERRVNDVGGLAGAVIDREHHGVTLFEKRVDAMLLLLTNSAVGAFKVDALRRSIEGLPSCDYTSLDYYVKWLNAIRDLLIEQGVVDRAELESRIAVLAAEEA